MNYDLVTVMSFNVYMDGHRHTNGALDTCESIRTCGADVVCLQETNVHWQRFIEGVASICEAYPHRAFMNDKYKYGGLAVLSKYPIHTEPEVGSSFHSERVFKWWYAAWRVDLMIPQSNSDPKPIHILNVHLRAPFPSNPWKVGNQRLLEIRKHWDLVKDVSGNNPVLVVGDFNCRNGECMDFLKDQGLQSALRVTNNMYTWRWKCLTNMFDHMWYNPRHLQIEDCDGGPRILLHHRGGSDHYPIIATFRIRGVTV